MSLTAAQREDLAFAALAIAREASALILDVYAQPFDVEYKGTDDPVTRADREANALICARLLARSPGVPIVAEESEPDSFAGYAEAPAAWFVDPLDGTREFVSRNGEFAVMIGLAERGRATVGVVVCPALGRDFLGFEGGPGLEVTADRRVELRVSSVGDLAAATAVVSRSHRSAAMDRALAGMGAFAVVPTGSSGVKAVRVAAGEADLYVQLGPAGKLWDACAPEAIVRAAGGEFTDARGAPFDYRAPSLENARGLVAANRALHAAAIARALAG